MVAASAGTTPWVHPVTAYPPEVQAEVARRREDVLGRARGRVLDLDQPEVAERFAAVGRTHLGRRADPIDAADEPYDTVIATGVLAAFADLEAIVVALARCVADDGALLVVEPVGRPGWSHLLRASVAERRSGAPWTELHLDRDVPAAIRAAGLVICDLDRGVLGDQPPSLRHWITGRAVRIAPA
jgi:hypothetical protein